MTIVTMPPVSVVFCNWVSILGNASREEILFLSRLVIVSIRNFAFFFLDEFPREETNRYLYCGKKVIRDDRIKL